MMIEGRINKGPIHSGMPTPWYAGTYYGTRMLGKGGDSEEGVCGGVVSMSKPEIQSPFSFQIINNFLFF